MDSSSGFSSSPRFDCFPAGLRVLVVDDDPTWLKILVKMLKKCNYEVTTCNLAREALNLLRERKDGFDIVISDVNMPDMDGFKLLEHVGLEMDLPVIMMSVDGETSKVMKGVQHGACDYLLKPIRMKELKNIWQHVFRKRIHEVRDIEGFESFEEEIHMFGNGNELVEDGYLFSGDMVLGKKRKDVDNKHNERMCGDSSSVKKSRVVWTVDLHQKFVKAVNQIGFDKVGPKKILDLMGVSWLTRENVASHLQKYRLYLSRLQKENELKTGFCGMKHSGFPPKDPFANSCFPNSQNSITLQQKIGTKESYCAPAHEDDSKISEGSMKGVFPSMPLTEFKNSRFGDVIDPPKTSTTRISFGHSYGSVDPEVRSEPKIQTQYPWTIETPSIQFKQEPKPHLSSEKENKIESTSALFSAQPQPHLLDSHAFGKIPCTKNQGLEQNLFDDLESSQKNFILGNGSASKLWDDESNCFSTQGEFIPQNINFGNIESFGRVNQDLVVDIPPQLYDDLSFDYVCDPVEYHAINQGVYIA